MVKISKTSTSTARSKSSKRSPIAKSVKTRKSKPKSKSKPKPKPKSKPINEYQLQAKICDYLRTKYPQVIFHSSLNGFCRQVSGSKAMRITTKSYEDLIIDEARGGRFGLRVELKAPGKIKTPTDANGLKHRNAQLALIRKHRAKGYMSFMCDNFDMFVQFMHTYMEQMPTSMYVPTSVSKRLYSWIPKPGTALKLSEDAMTHASGNFHGLDAMILNEYDLQARICDYLRREYPHVLFHSSLTGFCPATTGGKAMRITTKSYEDFIIDEARGGKFGIRVELKAPGKARTPGDVKGREHRDAQRYIMQQHGLRGYVAFICDSYDMFIYFWRSYMSLPPTQSLLRQPRVSPPSSITNSSNVITLN